MARIFRSRNEELGVTLGSGANVPLEASKADSDSSTPVLREGDKLGRYVVLTSIGRGGMGVVYSAYDPELDRKVALKLLRGSLHGSKPDVRESLRARLMREAQAMAKLNHPNVITVHDVGTFAGHVFIAMEFVDGPTLTDWLQHKSRPWREVLGVFLAAGRGLEAAHQAGLVHRDFKPDNVLLDHAGRVLVTDFGLARAAAGKTDSFSSVRIIESTPVLTAHLTCTGALVGTPAYMAPEQLAGERSGALTDQFSFCVALYEGLYGHRPFPGKVLAELIESVSSGEIKPPPREATVPRWLRRAVMRGLAAAPDERYPSVAALLTALRSDPTRKWRRRAAYALPAGVLAVGLLAYREEAEPPSFCESVARQLDGVWDPSQKAKIAAAFERVDRPFASDAWAATEGRVDAYTQRWVSMQTEACRAEAEGTQAQALVALRMACLGRGLAQVRAFSELLAQADLSVVLMAGDAAAKFPSLESCANVQQLSKQPEPPDAAVRTALEQELARAQVLFATGHFDDGVAVTQVAVERAQSVGDRWVEARALAYTASAADVRGDVETAEALYHEALSAAVASRRYTVIAKAAEGLVWLYGQGERPIEVAERWAAHGLAAVEAGGGDIETWAALVDALGMTYINYGRYDDAQRELERELELLENALGPDDPALGPAVANYGQLLGRRGRHAESKEAFERALGLIIAYAGEHHPMVASALDNLGVAHGELGEYDKARELHTRALQIRTAAMGEHHPHNGRSHHNIAVAAGLMGDEEVALEHAKRELEICEHSPQVEGMGCASAHGIIGNALARLDQIEAAIVELETAVKLASARRGPDDLSVANFRINLGSAYAKAGQLPRALALVEQGLEARRKVLGARHPKVARALTTKAEILLDAKRNQEALVAAQAAFDINSESEISADERAQSQFTLAQAQWVTGTPEQRREARRLAQGAVRPLQNSPGRNKVAAVIEAWLTAHPGEQL